MRLPNKIYITGGSGSGKTTLIKKISKVLGCPCYNQDHFKYSEDFQIKYSDDERAKRLNTVLRKKRWIIEGVYDRAWIESILNKAELIIVLDISKMVCLWRVYKRSRSIMKETDKHKFKDMVYLLRRTNNYKKRVHRNLLELIENKNKEHITLKNKRQVEKFLEDIKNHAASAN